MKALSLNLHRDFFARIFDGSKKIEYRDRTDYWERRLLGATYTHIKFRNGYLKIAPEMVVELKKVVTEPDCFELHLGKVVSSKNAKLLK